MQPPSFLFMFFFFNDPATTEIYTLSLHDALPIPSARGRPGWQTAGLADESPRSVQLVDRVIDVALDLPDVGVIAVDGVQYVPRPDKVGLCARIRGAKLCRGECSQQQHCAERHNNWSCCFHPNPPYVRPVLHDSIPRNWWTAGSSGEASFNLDAVCPTPSFRL